MTLAEYFENTRGTGVLARRMPQAPSTRRSMRVPMWSMAADRPDHVRPDEPRQPAVQSTGRLLFKEEGGYQGKRLT